ncbi:Protein phosphatase, putative [Hondaea fermentalgiana]|uniref:protein-serine/threonine phosphatase n=1 Tax=Hondaea fermentalgiana TaxID=2315210 RepID=A0A2R5G0F6_9STRA|nr:Protein phosphatase, putative [Hondaea fermentalgiana]|eukprot:GBG24005.1 Protein phosphatase, putative [Hondaea fermentalgiana]
MGGYLDKPNDRVLRDEGAGAGSRLRHGSACMQGWRPKMEDAHMAVFDLVDAHRRVDGVFAVFDGHGGKEVSQFCAKYLLRSLRANPRWQSPDVAIGECFRDALLRLDTSLVSPKGQSSLQRLQNEEDVVVCIHRDIFLFLGTPGSPLPVLDPLARVPRRFSTTSLCEEPYEAGDDGSTAPFGSFCGDLETLYSVPTSPSASLEGSIARRKDSVSSLSSQEHPNPALPGPESLSSLLSQTQPPRSPRSLQLTSTSKRNTATQNPHRSDAQASAPLAATALTTAAATSVAINPFEDVLQQSRAEMGKPSIGTPSNIIVETSRKKRTRKVLKRVNPVWERIRQIGVERGIAPADLSAVPAPVPTLKKSEASAKRRPGSSGVGIEIVPRAKLHLRDTKEMVVIDKGDLSSKVPGYDSGSTALVAVVEPTTDLRVKRLTVVNAGDSRCVLARGSKAVEMSIDHAPHLDGERARIEQAGGAITEDGRIFGKLNLSRAIGDHRFKDRRHPSRKQVVTSWADVRETWVYEGIDEFMVLACDGIWDTMTSQEVVDFIRPRLAQGLSLAEISEDLCRTCLADDPQVDPGTDNMSVVIVTFFSKAEQTCKRDRKRAGSLACSPVAQRAKLAR